jgi:hypothetical protein
MVNKETLVADTITFANTVELVQATINKVGLEYIAPLDNATQEEQISKAIVAQVNGGAA